MSKEKKQLVGVQLLEEVVERLKQRRDELGFATNSDYLKHLIQQDMDAPATLPMFRAVPATEPEPDSAPEPVPAPIAIVPAPEPLPPPGPKQPLPDFLKLFFWMFVGGPLVWIATRFDYTAVARKYVTGPADSSRHWRAAFIRLSEEPVEETTLGEALRMVAQKLKALARNCHAAIVARLRRVK